MTAAEGSGKSINFECRKTPRTVSVHSASGGVFQNLFFGTYPRHWTLRHWTLSWPTTRTSVPSGYPDTNLIRQLATQGWRPRRSDSRNSASQAGWNPRFKSLESTCSIKIHQACNPDRLQTCTNSIISRFHFSSISLTADAPQRTVAKQMEAHTGRTINGAPHRASTATKPHPVDCWKRTAE